MPASFFGPDDRSTRAGVETAIVAGAVIVRLGILVQLVVGMRDGWDVTQSRLVYLSAALLAAATSIAMCVRFIRERRVEASLWTLADVTVAVACLPVVASVLPSSHLIASWAYWPGALGINAAALAAIWIGDRRMIGMVAALVTVVTLASTWSAAGVGLGTLIGNAVTCVVFAAAAHVVTSFLRGIADENDELRSAATLSGREAEMMVAKLTMHDPAGLLGLLGDETTPLEQIAPLRKQARLEANRLRSYLQSTPSGPSPVGEARSLPDIVRGAIAHFGDQPITPILDLAVGVVLRSQEAAILERALVTLLHNVRRYAGASEVVLHADRFGGAWELVVRDNGRGFVPESTELGFGLKVQVIEELERLGMSVDIWTAPGEGTAVTITGDIGAGS